MSTLLMIFFFYICCLKILWSMMDGDLITLLSFIFIIFVVDNSWDLYSKTKKKSGYDVNRTAIMLENLGQILKKSIWNLHKCFSFYFAAENFIQSFQNFSPAKEQI